MTAWAVFLASLLLLQDCSSIPQTKLGVNAAVIQQRRPSPSTKKLPLSAEAVQVYNELDERNIYDDGFVRRKRQLEPDSVDDSSDSIVLNLQGELIAYCTVTFIHTKPRKLILIISPPGIAADLLESTSTATSTLPWCSDLSSLSTPSLSIPTSSMSDTLSSTSSSIATSSVITSSSAGNAVCIALPTSSSTYLSLISIESSASLTSPQNSVQTVVVAPSGGTRSITRPRSTRTVTAIQTLQRQVQPTPSTSIIEVTSTVYVLSTTTHLNTVYTTITPRPTAAFLTS